MFGEIKWVDRRNREPQDQIGRVKQREETWGAREPQPLRRDNKRDNIRDRKRNRKQHKRGPIYFSGCDDLRASTNPNIRS